MCRFTTGDDPQFGLVDGGGQKLAAITGDPLYSKIELTGKTYAMDEVRLLAPVIPRSKILGVRRNYADHASEMGGEAPSEPSFFLIPNTAVVGPGDPVLVPPGVGEVHYEGELAVVIGRMCKDVQAEDAAKVIWGYTCANDVTARALQAKGEWAFAKGMDTFCPLGPWIETDVDVTDVRVSTRVDGETVQDGSTEDMVHGIGALIEAASKAFTLLPGDVILTGTPAGVGPVAHGQEVTVEVDQIGSLSNRFMVLADEE